MKLSIIFVTLAMIVNLVACLLIMVRQYRLDIVQRELIDAQRVAIELNKTMADKYKTLYEDIVGKSF
jgi:hypothetical protein